MFFEKLKNIFYRKEVPQEARDIYERSRNTRELLRGLDELLTRNEVEFRELSKEIVALEGKQKEEEAKIKEGKITGRQKRNALLSIRRLRKQLDNLDHRLRIFDRNMNLHLSLIGKVQDIEAMQLKGVQEEHIDEILLDFESHLEDYAETLTAASVVEAGAAELDAKEEKELRQIEEEILGEKAERAVEEEEEREKALKKEKRKKKAPLRAPETLSSSKEEDLPSEEETPRESPGEMELE